MITIIECGALYALTLVVLLVTYETHSNGAYVVTDIVRIHTRRALAYNTSMCVSRLAKSFPSHSTWS